MVVAALIAHVRNGFFMNWSGAQPGEGFEYHVLVVGLAAALVLRGGGLFSLDRIVSAAGFPSSASRSSRPGQFQGGIR